MRVVCGSTVDRACAATPRRWVERKHVSSFAFDPAVWHPVRAIERWWSPLSFSSTRVRVGVWGGAPQLVPANTGEH